VFNFQGSELIIVLLLALVVLGPEKLPEAMRRAGRFYADLKKMSSSFQDEFRSVVDEPMREMRETATALRDSADFTKLAEGARPEKPKSAEMTDAPALAAADGDATAVPPDLPLAPSGSSPDTDGFGSLPSPRRDEATPEDEETAT
jgi:sec-independent protein translocase protein TatB